MARNLRYINTAVIVTGHCPADRMGRNLHSEQWKKFAAGTGGGGFRGDLRGSDCLSDQPTGWEETFTHNKGRNSPLESVAADFGVICAAAIVPGHCPAI